jgi:hypothetical protein
MSQAASRERSKATVNQIDEVTAAHMVWPILRKRFDMLTPAEYSVDDANEAFTINGLANTDSVNVRG